MICNLNLVECRDHDVFPFPCLLSYTQRDHIPLANIGDNLACLNHGPISELELQSATALLHASNRSSLLPVENAHARSDRAKQHHLNENLHPNAAFNAIALFNGGDLRLQPDTLSSLRDEKHNSCLRCLRMMCL